MRNIFFVTLLLISLCKADVSHLGVKHPGYSSQKPEHPLELPGAGSTNIGTVEYPKVVSQSPQQIPEASSGNVQNQLPNSVLQGTSNGGLINSQQQEKTHVQGHGHDDHGHHYHGEDGKYNPHDDGTGWDIRKSVPGEPGRDYPTYDTVPDTAFTCKDKVPGYYADDNALCQVFRICTTNSLKTHYSFLCPNGTLFNQRVLTCDWWMNVDCASSSEFYYTNAEIGKMPEGPRLMQEVKKMLQAPDKNPYYYTQQQMQYLQNTLTENQIHGIGSSQDVYLPAKQPVVTSTTPTTTTTRTTTTTTTPKPTVVTQNLNRIDTSDKEFNLNQQSFQNVQVQEKVTQQNLENVKNQNIPPQPPSIEQSGLSNVKTQQKTQVGVRTQQTDSKLHVSPELKTSPKLHVSSTEPTLHLSKLKNDTNKAQPLFVSQPVKPDNKLYTSELSDQKDNNLFVSPVAQKQQGELFLSQMPQTSKPADTQLFTSQLTPTNNVHPLFVSQVLQNQNGNVFLSQMLQPQPLNPTDGQLFTSQLTMTKNPQPLSISQVAMRENQLFTSPERTSTNNKTLFTSSSAPKALLAPQPPKNEKMDQLFLSQIGQSSLAGVSGYDYPKQTPVVSQQEAVQNPSLTVTKEQTHTVTHSEKTTHVFQNVNDGPDKISLLDQAQKTVPAVGQGVQQQGVQQQGFVNVPQQQIIPQTGISNVQQQQQGVQQQGFVNVPQQQVVPQTGISNVQRQKQQGVQQQGFSNVQKQQGVPQIGISNAQRVQGVQQQGFSNIQQQQVRQQTIPGNTFQPQNFGIPEITNNQAFQQIDKIQQGFQQLTQQNLLDQFGKDQLNPRIGEQVVSIPDFGRNFQIVQPNFAGFVQNQGYDYQPNFQEQNLQNFNFHGQNTVPNFNVDVSKGGLTQNFKGQTISQRTQSNVQSTFRGQNSAFKQTTKVDIVPSLSFHLNDEGDKQNFISAVLGGIIDDSPRFQGQASANQGINQFLPFDARYSSYNGPSSYLVPQMSVQRLPSDSGYYR